MPVFQLDECLNDPEFARECRESAKAQNILGVRVKRFPRSLKGQLDPVVLNELLQRDGTLLTKDRGIARRHADHVPCTHPGIVIIANAPGHAGTMTVELVKKILGTFKAKLKLWHELPLQNSIVEINQTGIEVSRKSDTGIVPSKYVQFDQSDWERNLLDALTANANPSAKTN
jgi:hypothetical protein